MVQSSTTLIDPDVAKVKELWGDTEGTWRTAERIHWTQHPKVNERINRLISGDPQIDRFQYFIQRHLRRRLPVQRALTLGCGHGELERGLLKYNLAKVHEGVDISDGAVAEAARLSAGNSSRLRYRVSDLNSITLPRFQYDVVFGVMSIHHVAALEHLFEEVSAALKPNGYFFLDEFVGPNQFQWSDPQLDAINDEIALMPERFKQCVEDRSIIKGEVPRWTIDEMNCMDPSEAIRSSDILPLLSKYFEVVDVKGYGGSILHMLLDHIAGNFAEDVPDAMYYLECLFHMEDHLLELGTIRHDFAVVIARRKTTFRTWIDFYSR